MDLISTGPRAECPVADIRAPSIRIIGSRPFFLPYRRHTAVPVSGYWRRSRSAIRTMRGATVRRMLTMFGHGLRGLSRRDAAAYSGRAPIAPGSYRRGREIPVVAKRRSNHIARRTDYFQEAFNSILVARRRPRPVIWRAGRLSAARRRRRRPLCDSLLGGALRPTSRPGGRRLSAAMWAARNGRQPQLYKRHSASSAAARRRRRLSPDGRLLYAAYLGAVGP